MFPAIVDLFVGGLDFKRSICFHRRRPWCWFPVVKIFSVKRFQVHLDLAPAVVDAVLLLLFEVTPSIVLRLSSLT